MAYTFYHLAHDKETMRKLQAELDENMEANTVPGIQELARWPYLNAVIKESELTYLAKALNSESSTDDLVHIQACDTILSIPAAWIVSSRKRASLRKVFRSQLEHMLAFKHGRHIMTLQYGKIRGVCILSVGLREL